MANYCINVFLDDENQKKIDDAGLTGSIVEIDGKKAVQIPVSRKEHKKLVKGFADLNFDSNDAGVLPKEAEDTLMGFVTDSKTLDVMKFAIMKLYNPLAGKAPRAAASELVKK